jgi:hypothetical protein
MVGDFLLPLRRDAKWFLLPTLPGDAFEESTINHLLQRRHQGARTDRDARLAERTLNGTTVHRAGCRKRECVQPPEAVANAAGI